MQDLTPSSSSFAGRYAPGAVLAGRFRVVGLIGEGGMGEVYLVDDLQLGHPVALKLLPADVVASPVLLERFRQEVRTARRVSHPNVARVHDIGEADGVPFLTMEYVEGEDLARTLRRIGRFPAEKAVEIARQVCAGLAAAHAAGVLHRDIKPANVMLDADGRAKLTDFGLAGVRDRPGRSDSGLVGTPAYMAPEQFAGGAADVRSDVHALGLLLYELFSGRRVRQGHTLDELRREHGGEAPPAPSTLVEGLDARVDRAVMRCLERDPALRPASANAVLAALPGGDPLAAALAAGETPAPELVAAAGPTEGFSPRAAVAWLATGLVLLATLALSDSFGPPSLSGETVSTVKKRPEALAENARALLVRLVGPTHAVADADWVEVDAASADWFAEHFDDVQRRAVLSTPANPLRFWYRTAPTLWSPDDLWPYGTIRPDRPPPFAPGMETIALDARGALRLLLVPPVPSAATSPPTSGENSGADWSALFEAAGFVESELQPAAATLTPPIDVDAHRAWRGTWPGAPEVPLRVEAGAIAGRPVWFTATIDRPDDAAMAPAAASPPIAGWLMDLVLPLLAVALAWRNLRTGRGDRTGAFRIAMVVLAGHMLVALSHAGGHFDVLKQPELLAFSVRWSLYQAGLTWVSYVALEPTVRRHWPHAMISWSRALGGRLRDALVGRDVLIGLVIGLGVGVLMVLAPRVIPHPAIDSFAGAEATLGGPLYLLCEVLHTATDGLMFGMLSVSLLAMLQIVVRKRLVAMAVWVLIGGAVTLFQAAGDLGPWLALCYAIVTIVTMVVLLVRVGMVAFILTMILMSQATMLVLAPEHSAWRNGAIASALALFGVLLLWSFRTSLGGRSVLPQD